MSLRLPVLFGGAIVLVFAIALFTAKDFPPLDRLHPLLLAGVGLVLALIVLVQEIRIKEADKTGAKTGDMDITADEFLLSRLAHKRSAKLLGWIVGLYLGIWVVGFKIAIILWLILLSKLEGKVKWSVTIVLTGILIFLVFVLFEKVMMVFWPEGLLQRWLDLPRILF